MEYFVVGIANMEVGNPWAEAWVDNDEHIFCQLTPQRMDEIELIEGFTILTKHKMLHKLIFIRPTDRNVMPINNNFMFVK